MNFDALAGELIRALRGPRSQTALSRRLGARSNIVHSWEAGRRFPTAAKFLWVAGQVGAPAGVALGRFYRGAPAWLADIDPATPPGVASLLEDLRGGTPIKQLAERAGRSRFAVARWLKGDAEPRLPDFLRMIEACSLRLLDFLAAFVDPATLPSVAEDFRRLRAAREAAYGMPWSHAVLRALELSSYRRLPGHRPGFIARQTGMPFEQESRALAMLGETGQIRFEDGRYAPSEVRAVDTRDDPKRDRELKAFWSRLAAERVEAGSDGLFSYNLFTVSTQDLQRLRELHLAYFRELRGIVGASAPAEHLVLANVQLFDLAPP